MEIMTDQGDRLGDRTEHRDIPSALRAVVIPAACDISFG